MSLSHEQLQELSLLQDKYSNGDITKTQYDTLKKEIFAEGKDVADNPSGNIIVAILILIGNLIRWIWRQGISLSKFIHKEVTKWGKKKEIPLWKIYTVLGILIGSLLIGNIVYENHIESIKQAEIKATNDAKMAQENAEKEKVAKAKANTPKPTIEIQSPQENQGKRTTYILKFIASNATNITVNGTSMAINDNGAYTKEVPLDNIETTISIVAKNAYHSTESSFLIARDKNADDIAKEEKAKKDAENAKNLANTEEFKTKCLSHWGGSFTPLKDYVKKNVKDPDSFEHIETGFINKGDYALVAMKYRAKNSFGGYVVEFAGAMANWNCEMTEFVGSVNPDTSGL